MIATAISALVDNIPAIVIGLVALFALGFWIWVGMTAWLAYRDAWDRLEP